MFLIRRVSWKIQIPSIQTPLVLLITMVLKAMIWRVPFATHSLVEHLSQESVRKKVVSKDQ